MTPREIEQRLYACAHLQQADLDRLVRAGIPKTAIWRPDCIARASVVFHPKRLFDFAEEVKDGGEVGDAYIVLARSEMGDVADLVAWQPRSSNVASWLGRTAILGAECVYRARLSGNGALVVHDDPLAWLRAERRGIVILDAKRAAGLLYCVGPLSVSDRERARDLRSALTRRPPRILVASTNIARAA
jgi:hypothetical protein